MPTLMNVQERTSGGKTMSIVRNLDVIAVLPPLLEPISQLQRLGRAGRQPRNEDARHEPNRAMQKTMTHDSTRP